MLKSIRLLTSNSPGNFCTLFCREGPKGLLPNFSHRKQDGRLLVQVKVPVVLVAPGGILTSGNDKRKDVRRFG